MDISIGPVLTLRMKPKTLTQTGNGSQDYAEISNGTESLVFRKTAQADDIGAMLLNDGIHGGNRFGGALIEEALRSRDEIGQRQADQPVARAGSH